MELIDRQGLNNHLRSIIDSTNTEGEYSSGFIVGVEFAISHAESMPTIPQDTDCISRAEALHRLSHMAQRQTSTIKAIKAMLETLPSVQSERKKGRWNPDDGNAFWVCSACGFASEAFSADILYKFCPNCGADMEGETP